MVRKVRPSGKRTLRLRFAGDRRQYDLDLTGLIARSRHFAPLMEDAETFAKIDIVDDGLGVAWPLETKWGALIFLDQCCAGWRKSSYQCRARTLRSGENRWVSRSPRPPSCSELAVVVFKKLPSWARLSTFLARLAAQPGGQKALAGTKTFQMEYLTPVSSLGIERHPVGVHRRERRRSWRSVTRVGAEEELARKSGQA